MKQIAIALIAYKEVNLTWLKKLKENFKATIILSFDEPKSWIFTKFCDNFLVNSQHLGFGKNRRMSMLLASEFGEYCLITDGDGQFPMPSLEKVLDILQSDHWDVVIPQRQNRSLKMEYNGKIVDRINFERLEAICAKKVLNKNDLGDNFDAQPGLYGFKRNCVHSILPKDKDWLADFEITINAIQKTKHVFTNVEIDEMVQEKTTFSIDNQLKKFERIARCYNINIGEIYEQNRFLFTEFEQEIMKLILSRLKKESDVSY